jgi:hypothetical protein
MMRLHQLMHSSSPRAIIALGFASSDYCIYLNSAAPILINAVIARRTIDSLISVYYRLFNLRISYIFILYSIIIRGTGFVKSIQILKETFSTMIKRENSIARHHSLSHLLSSTELTLVLKE